MASGTAKLSILGVGNRWRGDDGAGLEVAHRLRGLIVDAIEIHEMTGEAGEIVTAMTGRDAVILVDAVLDASAEPGTIHRFDAAAEPLPAFLGASSTHGFGVAQAVELARRLGRLPRRLVIYAVVGQSFALGEGLSPPVAGAVKEMVGRILAELDTLW